MLHLSCKAAPSPNHLSIHYQAPAPLIDMHPPSGAHVLGCHWTGGEIPASFSSTSQDVRSERRDTAVHEHGKQRPLSPSANTTSVVRFRGHSRSQARPGQPWEAVTDWTPRVTRLMRTQQHAGRTASSSKDTSETAHFRRTTTNFGVYNV